MAPLSFKGKLSLEIKGRSAEFDSDLLSGRRKILRRADKSAECGNRACPIASDQVIGGEYYLPPGSQTLDFGAANLLCAIYVLLNKIYGLFF